MFFRHTNTRQATPPFPTALSPDIAEDQLFALADTEDEAECIAEQYGIALVNFSYGVATFHTDEDPYEVIARGRKKHYPELSINKVTKLKPPQTDDASISTDDAKTPSKEFSAPADNTPASPKEAPAPTDNAQSSPEKESLIPAYDTQAPSEFPKESAKIIPDIAEDQLFALADTEDEAERIAEQYGITLVNFSYGVATFHTDEDPYEVIARGRKNGYPELSINKVTKLKPPPD